jgi:hypothetical protein
MNFVALGYVVLANVVISVLVAFWLYFDAKARALPSYTWQPVVIILVGLIGLWLPYILYYFIFRPPGKLIRCAEGKHYKLEYLKGCPFCDPRLVWTARKTEAYHHIWKVVDEVQELLDKVKPVSEKVKDRETNAWFQRLTYYQESFSRYINYFLLINLILFFFVLLLLFFQTIRPFYGLIFLILLLTLGYLGLVFYRLTRLLQAEIIRTKLILSTMVGERAESFRFAEKTGFMARSSWSLQLVTGVMLAIGFLAISVGMLQPIVSTDPYILVFELLAFGLFFALYLALAGKVKTDTDLEQVKELHKFLRSMVGEEELKKVTRRRRARKTSVKKTTRKRRKATS